MKNNNLSRRNFISTTATAAAGFSIVPSNTIAGLGHKAPSDKLNIAGIGIGGMGKGNLSRMANENIVALCDVDWTTGGRINVPEVFKAYPKAARYYDWRKMYDEMGKSIDAIMCATADHTHAIITANAIAMGKHAYTQKPLTHSVYESRLLTKLAAKHKVATQMGNQGSSAEGVKLICEWIWNGEIGEVKEVEAYTNRPIWPQGLSAPEEKMSVPSELKWDLFIGPAEYRPYNSAYHPWVWRGWWDFGTGALGDMACHVMHPVFTAMKLRYPTKVVGSSTPFTSDGAPNAEIVHLTFPARQKTANVKINLPEVKVTWYDGGLTPRLPENWPADRRQNSGVIFHGSKDTLVCGEYGTDPILLSGRVPNVPQTERRIEGHELDWIRACKESPENRIPTASDFKDAGPFNEMVVMGVLSTRLQSLNKVLHWDGPNMTFTNISDSDELRVSRRETIPAKEFANNLIKHKYRDGWTLPDMPA
ncbi:gfo/Idh/MocA family oxidoreductase [Maribellus comscasis]|uniref:Gfo/Idh/MocA family oxidoreductase n=1 Tax=Maribellus comscasis TaxID=2681766 RepID=A0A6I6JV48_9BACT|nr:Gfo/Idh/MocA family oxidoreductase [Maribellus comscasis]QGY44970.1 gfo/Idh/MocA family oxidoreductase [Maribellus comscasis]